MADIYFLCDACNASLALEDEFAGRPVDCPACGQSITVPKADVTWSCPQCGSAMSAPAAMTGNTVPCADCDADVEVPGQKKPKLALHKEAQPCPHCNAELDPDTVLCVQCGYNVETGSVMSGEEEAEPGMPPEKKRQIIIAAAGGGVILLALLLWLVLGRGGGSESRMTSPPPRPSRPAAPKKASSPPPAEPAPASEPAPAAAAAEPAEPEPEPGPAGPTPEEIAAHEAEQAARAEQAAEWFGDIYPVPPIVISRSLRIQGTRVEFKGEDYEKVRDWHQQKEWLALINYFAGSEYEEYPEEQIIKMAARKMRSFSFDLFIQTPYKNYNPKNERFLMEKPAIVVLAFNLDSVSTPMHYTIGKTRRSSRHQWTIHPRHIGFYKKWNFENADGLIIALLNKEFREGFSRLKDKHEERLLETQKVQGIDQDARKEALKNAVRDFYKEAAQVASQS